MFFRTSPNSIRLEYHHFNGKYDNVANDIGGLSKGSFEWHNIKAIIYYKQNNGLPEEFFDVIASEGMVAADKDIMLKLLIWINLLNKD